jgi:PST family polysaccharide transporter
MEGILEPGPLETPRRGLGLVLARGAAWTAAANMGAALLNAAVALALTRLLTPADFGIQSAVVTITAFFGSLAETGVGSAIVQHDDLEQPELSSIFWSGLAASLVAYLSIVAAAPLIARLFTSATLEQVLPVAALNVVFLGTAIVPGALLRRRLAFATMARAKATGAVAGAIVAVATALAGGRYWALIGYSLSAVAVQTVFICRASRWSPSRTLRLAHLARVRGYAGSMVSFLTMNYWSRNLDNLLIGRFLGIASLGYYSVAQRLVGAPLQLLTGSIAPLLHPTFAAMGDDAPRQRAAYLDLVRVTALLTFPVGATLWALSDPLVLVVAGPAWMPSAPVVRALGLLAAIQPVNMLCGSVFMARNAAHVMLRCATVGAAAVVVGMLLGLSHGVAGVAWGYSVAYLLVSAPVSTLSAFRLLHGRAPELARTLARPLLAGVAVLVVERALVVTLAGVLSPALTLAVGLALSALALGLAGLPTARRLRAASRAGRTVA